MREAGGYKTCTKCRVEKPIADFWKKLNGTAARCISCANEDHRAWRSANQDKLREAKRSYRKRIGIDHIVPLAKGGSDGPENIQLLCAHCNRRKSAKDPIVFMQENGFLL